MKKKKVKEKDENIKRTVLLIAFLKGYTNI
jgi:hypothetical protein